MKHLSSYKLFESVDIKQQIIDQVNKTIDDAMLPFVDEGFEECEILSKPRGSGYDVFKKYTRPKKTIGNILLNGIITDGKITYYDEEYEHFDYDIVQMFINCIEIINGTEGMDIGFSVTNFYEDKIIIYFNV